MSLFFWSSAALLLLFLPSILIPADACYITGNAYCDRCWDAKGDSKYREPIASTKVTVNCSIQSETKSAFLVASGTTLKDGSFKVVLDGATTRSFLSTLFISSSPSFGLLPKGEITSCSVVTDGGDCGVRTLHDGKCNAGGKEGNGRTSSLDIVNRNPNSADISIKDDICNSPAIRSDKCPAAPPPPSPPQATKPPPSASNPSPPPPLVASSPPPRSPPGATGDPHFTGADGSRFDFSGEPNTTFCLISDAHIHINAYYGGRYERYGNNARKSLTWIRKIGILWGHHTLVLAAREGARWQYDNGYMASIDVDGQFINLRHVGDFVSFADGAIEIRWTGAKVQSADDLIDVYEVTVAKILRLRLMIRPEIALLRTETDGLVHVDFELPLLDVSENVHGILGQTYRADHRNRLSKQKLEWSDLLRADVVPGDNAEDFLDGTVSDYTSSGLLRSDCRYSQFSQGDSRDDKTMKAFGLVQANSVSTPNEVGSKSTTIRKLLSHEQTI